MNNGLTEPATAEILQKAISQKLAGTRFERQPAELYDPLAYFLEMGGKRLRPLLTLMGCTLFTDDFTPALSPAIGVELFHNFTLIHDDIMDKAPIRRGKSTVHEKWNTNIAILSGDVTMIEAYDLMAAAPAPVLQKILRQFNQTAREVCEGQQFDMNFETAVSVSMDEYIRMITLKTSVLLGFSLELGAIIGGAADRDTKLLYECGKNAGIAFQIMDDYLDVFGDNKKVGKQTGGDILSNKKTFLLLSALREATGSAGEALVKWYAEPTNNPAEKIAAVTKLFEELNVPSIARESIQRYTLQAYDFLHQVNVPDERKKVLRPFLSQLLSRDC